MNHPDRPDLRYNSRLGILFFSIYLVLYLGFVLVNAFAPARMETIVFAGLNLAITYGFALIAAALVLALLYGFLCRPEPLAKERDPQVASQEEKRA